MVQNRTGHFSFPLREFALKMSSMFGGLRVLKRLTSDDRRNKMTNKTLKICLRLRTTKVKADIDKTPKSKKQ